MSVISGGAYGAACVVPLVEIGTPCQQGADGLLVFAPRALGCSRQLQRLHPRA